jgi:hypothetical protein
VTQIAELDVTRADVSATPGSERPAEPELVEAARKFGNLDCGQRLVYKLLPSDWRLCIVADDYRIPCPTGTDPLVWLSQIGREQRRFEHGAAHGEPVAVEQADRLEEVVGQIEDETDREELRTEREKYGAEFALERAERLLEEQ